MTSSATETNDAQVVPESQTQRSIPDQVAEFAQGVSERGEFLKRLAAELSESFAVEMVAVAAPQWQTPMMLVSDPVVAQKIDQRAISELLKTSSPMPIACDVPLKTPAADGSLSTRGLRVQITSSPEQTAVLLIYDCDERPDAVRQVHDLKRLNEYAKSTRQVIDELPASDSSLQAPLDNLIAPPDLGERAVAAMRHRQSLQLFHRDLHLDATAFRVANETRRLIHCDRVTVLTRQRNRFRVRAVSGVAVVDRRSNSVAAIERLAQRSVVLARPLIMPGEEPLPPQIQLPLDEYLDETGVTTAIALPLNELRESNDDNELDAFYKNIDDVDGEIFAVMFLEYFTTKPPSAISPAMQVVSGEATLALGNALQHQTVFGLRFWKLLGKLFGGRRLAFVMSALLAIVGAVTAAAWIEIEHEVVATGTVVPAQQSQVFASVDGIVKELFVADGDTVSAGDRLMLLENADLETRAENLTGEIQTASQRLLSVQSLRLSPTIDPNQSNRLAIEERQLQSELSNLRSQQDLIKQQQEKLIIVSPIDGTVSGWQLQRQLSDRPVTRGNALLSIVNHEGPWSLRLQIPDKDAGPVLQCFEENSQLDVRFAVATQPESTYAATLDSLSTAARQNDKGDNVVDATARILISGVSPEEDVELAGSDEADSETRAFNPVNDSGSPGDRSEFQIFRSRDARVGADVTAKITCGKRSVLKSWFGDVFDFANRNILFYFR